MKKMMLIFLVIFSGCKTSVLQVSKVYDSTTDWSSLPHEMVTMKDFGAAPSTFITFEEDGTITTVHGSAGSKIHYYGTWKVENNSIIIKTEKEERIFKKVIMAYSIRNKNGVYVYMLYDEIDIDLEKILEYGDGANGLYLDGKRCGWILYYQKYD